MSLNEHKWIIFEQEGSRSSSKQASTTLRPSIDENPGSCRPAAGLARPIHSKSRVAFFPSGTLRPVLGQPPGILVSAIHPRKVDGFRRRHISIRLSRGIRYEYSIIEAYLPMYLTLT